MSKIVYNAVYGGFSLSDKAMLRLAELKGIKLVKTGPRSWDMYKDVETGKLFYPRDDYSRHDKDLVQVVEELGYAASGGCAKLWIEEVPDGTIYRIEEHDGRETIEILDAGWTVAL